MIGKFLQIFDKFTLCLSVQHFPSSAFSHILIFGFLIIDFHDSCPSEVALGGFSLSDHSGYLQLSQFLVIYVIVSAVSPIFHVRVSVVRPCLGHLFGCLSWLIQCLGTATSCAG